MYCFTTHVYEHLKSVLLFTVSCKVTGHEGTPGPNGIWAITKLGDVYVFDQDPLKVKHL